MDDGKMRNLRLRSELFRAIRDCFYRAGYLEVETPVKIHAPAPEEYIESVRAEKDFLRTSPELAMKVLLEDEGAEITVAGDGQQAVTLFSESPAGTFDAILMDMMMPVMDGLTATRTIRAMERPDAGTIPIIALTANAFAEDAEACFRAGMNAHLAKPLEIKKVVAAIAGCCGGEGRTET